MRLVRLLPLLLAAALAGCGGEREDPGAGTASLWITRDRGSEVVLTATVPAGLTALEALDRATDVETRYGGRFVQSIGGVEGDLGEQRDWFYFVNGLEADRSAADYRLRRGDVEWWDYRSWAEEPSVPVVVGAFPEPFLHGYLGERRPAVVVGRSPAAGRLARLIRGRVAARAPEGANVLRIVPGRGFRARRSGTRVEFVVGAEDAARLARNPRLARFRYEGLP